MVENQKSKTYQGIFIPDKYAKEMKKILDKKIANEKRKKIDLNQDFLRSLAKSPCNLSHCL